MTDNTNNKDDGKGKVIQTALEPAAKEFAKASEGVGKDLGESAVLVAKSVKALLTPLKALVWGFDQIEDLFMPDLEKKMEGVPEDRRIEPTLLVAGPTGQALVFAGHVPELRDLFANLLATAMDKETAQNAHPSFVEIIKQMSPDEARILRYMSDGKNVPMIHLQRHKAEGPGYSYPIRNFSLLGKLSGCEHVHLTPQYIDSLCRLGICEVPPYTYMTVPNAYDDLTNHPEIQQYITEEKAKEGVDVTIEQCLVRLTLIGKQFVDACVIGKDEETKAGTGPSPKSPSDS